MEKVQVLLRTAVRAFYEPHHAIIIETLIQHSACTANDLKTFFAQHVKGSKELGTWLSDLERAGLLSRYTRQVETRAKAPNRQKGAGSTTYYWIDPRRAVDATKYRVSVLFAQFSDTSTDLPTSHTLAARITRHSRPSTERKPYKCTRCKTEFTLLDLMHSRDPQGRGSGFLCTVCGEVIPLPPREGPDGGDTLIGLFNKQFRPIINLLRDIDQVEVPNITAESALAAAVPVKKKGPDAPQYTKSEQEIEEEEKVAPTAVKGITPAVEKIEISITTEQENNAAARAAEQEHRAQIAAQNKMPEWYERSTITDASAKAGPSTANVSASNASALNGVSTPAEDSKLNAEEQDQLQDFFTLLEQQNREQMQQRAQEEEDDEDDEDEDDFEDVSVANGPSGSLKRPFEDDSASNATSTPGAKRVKLDASAGTSAVGTPVGRSESDADDDEFEEVKM